MADLTPYEQRLVAWAAVNERDGRRALEILRDACEAAARDMRDRCLAVAQYQAEAHDWKTKREAAAKEACLVVAAGIEVLPLA